jgi:hypothetical protein
VGDCSEAYFCAVCGEKDMLIDKEVVDCQFHLLMELDKLTRDLDTTMNCPLGIGTSHIPLELDNRVAPDYLCSLHIIQSHI